jgi:hypothetical protein
MLAVAGLLNVAPAFAGDAIIRGRLPKTDHRAVNVRPAINKAAIN